MGVVIQGAVLRGVILGGEDGERDAESLAGDERRGKVHDIDGDDNVDAEGDVQMGEGDHTLQPTPGAEDQDNEKGKGKAVEVDQPMEHTSTDQDKNTAGHPAAVENSIELQAEQISEPTGSSTVTVGSESNPSSNSVHTLESMIS